MYPHDHSIERKYDQINQILEDSLYSGLFDGGCLIFAKALILRFGGNLVRIISPSINNQTEHYGALIDGVIYDGDGGIDTPSHWIQRIMLSECIRGRTLAFELGYDPHSDIPDDPAASKAIAKAL